MHNFNREMQNRNQNNNSDFYFNYLQNINNNQNHNIPYQNLNNQNFHQQNPSQNQLYYQFGNNYMPQNNFINLQQISQVGSEESKIQSQVQNTINKDTQIYANSYDNRGANQELLQQNKAKTRDVDTQLLNDNNQNAYNNQNNQQFYNNNNQNQINNNNNNNYGNNYNQFFNNNNNQNIQQINSNNNYRNQEINNQQFQFLQNPGGQNINQNNANSKKSEWNNEYVDIPYFKDLSIPIPSFVDNQTMNMLRQGFEKVNQQIEEYLSNSSRDNDQITNQIQEKFRNKNQIQEAISSNNNLDFYLSSQEYSEFERNQQSVIKSYGITEQNYISNNQEIGNKLIDFILKIQVSNQDSEDKFELEFKEAKQNITKCKFRYLLEKLDFQVDIEKIQKIAQYSCDQCKKINQNIHFNETNFQAFGFDFKKDKLLKTLLYAIMQNSIVNKGQQYSKKYLIQQLSNINLKSESLEVDNFIIRQIFLRFYSKINSSQAKAQKFLDKIFEFEFLSSVLLGYYKRRAKFFCGAKSIQENAFEMFKIFINEFFLDLVVIDSYSKQYSQMTKKKQKRYELLIYTEQNIKAEVGNVFIINNLKSFIFQQIKKYKAHN